jgi:gliding motility-associated-like protein
LRADGCKKDTNFTLRNQPDFTLDAVITKSSCSLANGAIELKVNPAGATDVYDFSGDFTSNLKTNLARGIYRAIVTRQGTDCTIDKNFILTNQTDFTVNANITKPSCNKTDGTIILSPSQGTVLDYDFSGDFISETKTNVGAGDYLAVLTKKSNACAFDTVISVDATPDFTVSANITTPSCNQTDGKIDLTVAPSGAYNFSGDLTSYTNPNLDLGTFQVTITRAGTRCNKDTSFNISTFIPLVNLSPNNTLICNNKAIRLKAQATPADNYTYNWFANDVLFATTSADSLTGVNSWTSNEYKVEVRKGNECPGVDSIIIKRPSIVRLVNTGHFFKDEKLVRLDFKVFNPADIVQDSLYVFRRSVNSNWIKIDSVSKSDSVYYNNLSSSNEGVFYYKLGLPTQLNVCSDTLQSRSQRNIQLVGIVKDAPDNQQETNLNWNSFVRWDSVVAEYQIWRGLNGGPLAFYVSGNLDTLAKYLNSFDAENQCYRIRAIEKSTAQRESWSNTVCLNYNTKVISFNIFTPNGDGHNDVLYFTNLHLYKESELHVFNRWGNKVFESKNYNNDWDGGGLPAGTYYYILDLKDGSKPIQRDVLLHR